MVQDIPPHMVNAVLAIEDRRFYSHPGIDPIGIARAIVRNTIGGGVRQGGSTITQQLAKNLFLSHERTYKRKIQEALLALWLEHQLTKDEILSAYLNRVYLGSGTYGIDAAAKLYFNKSATDVTLLEAATLAGLLKAPSRYSPHNNPDLAYDRAKVVLGAMQDAGYITEEEEQNARTITITENLTTPALKNQARYFADWIISGLDELIGSIDENIIVETSLNAELQTLAENTLAATIDAAQETSAVSQGAILIMRPDGAVVTMVGGKNYAGSQFNRAIQAKRQPGSAFKPIVYLTALEQGWKPDSIVLDDIFTEQESDYQPTNFKDEYYGEVTLTYALTYSMNTAAVRLMRDIGPKTVINTARRLGIFSPLEPDLSLALGSSAVSLAELTTAYASFANGGYAVYPYAITKITDEDGELYYVRSRRTQTRRVIDRDNAETITEMLQNVVANGTGRAAQIPGTDAAGKTGTSQDFRDAWFIGYTDSLVAGVWMGNDDNAPMNHVTGGSLPARTWSTIMTGSTDNFDPVSRSDFSTGGLRGLLDRMLGQDTYIKSAEPEESIRPGANLNE
jgi:penicillin-binding protein 1A